MKGSHHLHRPDPTSRQMCSLGLSGVTFAGFCRVIAFEEYWIDYCGIAS